MRRVVALKALSSEGERVEYLSVNGCAAAISGEGDSRWKFGNTNRDEIPTHQRILPGIRKYIVDKCLRQFRVGAVVGDGNWISGDGVERVGNRKRDDLIGNVRGYVRTIND